jgi:hypothetical protein
MTLSDQLNRLTEDIEAVSLPDVEDIVQAGIRRRRRRTGLGALAMVVLVLAVAAALTSMNRTAPPTPARTSHGPATMGLRTVATLELPNPTHGVAVDGVLWVVGGDTGTLGQVDPIRNVVTRQVHLPHSADFVAAMPGSSSLWVASTSDDLLMRIDRASLAVTQTLGSTPRAYFDEPVGILAAGGGIWVTNRGSNPSTAVEINDESGAVMRVVTLPGTNASGPVPVQVDQTYLWFLIGSAHHIYSVGMHEQDRYAGNYTDDIACGQGQVVYGRAIYTNGDEPTCQGPAKRIDELGYGPAELYGSGLSLDSVAGAAGQGWASDHSKTLYAIDPITSEATPAATLDQPSTVNQLVGTREAIWVLRGRTNQLIKLEPFMTPTPGR